VLTTEKKTILVAGGSGLIGTRLAELLESKSYRVILLSRNAKNRRDNIFHWDPDKKTIEDAAIQQADVIINLAGEGIADKRWSARRKRKIINSRILSTNLLIESLAKIPNKVEAFINASAIGIYGDTGEMIMHEDSPVSNDFLGQTCTRWEQAAMKFTTGRLVIFRIGIVLAQEGGMVQEVQKSIRFGFAPYFGTGKQYQSWIHIDDLCRMFSRAIRDSDIKGIYNAVSPGPLSNRNFMKLLSQIMGGNAFLIRIPKFFMQLLLGEMSKVVVEGSRVSSKKIEATGFTFKFPQANSALRNVLDEY
jgi:uncharacterized protein